MIEVSRERGTLDGIIAIVNEDVLGLSFHASLEFKLLIKVLEPRLPQSSQPIINYLYYSRMQTSLTR